MVDVDANVDMSEYYITELPISFGRINGYFNVLYSDLTTLKGSPDYIGGYFNCKNNNLVSLDYFPQTILGKIHLDGNYIGLNEFIKLFNLGYTPDQIKYEENLYILYRKFIVNKICNE